MRDDQQNPAPQVPSAKDVDDANILNELAAASGESHESNPVEPVRALTIDQKFQLVVAVGTIALAAGTGWLAWQTQQLTTTTAAMAVDARKAEAPFFAALVNGAGAAPVLTIQNFGNLPAFHVRTFCVVVPLNSMIPAVPTALPELESGAARNLWQVVPRGISITLDLPACARNALIVPAAYQYIYEYVAYREGDPTSPRDQHADFLFQWNKASGHYQEVDVGSAFTQYRALARKVLDY